MTSDSPAASYDWICTNLDIIILPFEALELHFLEGPHNPLHKQADI